jgi:hypothetical protein
VQASGKHHWPSVKEGNVSVDFSRPDPVGTGHEDLSYVVNLPEGWYAITNQERQVGAGLLTAIENGSAMMLEAGKSRSASLRAVAYQNVKQVSHVSPAGIITAE